MKPNSDCQWCDVSVIQHDSPNQYALSPSASRILKIVATTIYRKSGSDFATLSKYIPIKVKELAMIKDLDENAFFGCEFRLNITDLTHLKEDLLESLGTDYPSIGAAAETAFRSAVSAVKSQNPGGSLTSERALPSWEEARLTKWNDLKIDCFSTKQWASGLPSLVHIPISDMVLSEANARNLQLSDLHPFLMQLACSSSIGLLLTNQPKDLAEVILRSNCLPPNFCVLTSITGPDPESLQRLEDLKSINATTRGILIDPMISRMPPELLNLDGIHWSKAVSMANGDVPTEEQVKAVVNEIRYPDGSPKSQVTPKQKRKELISELTNAISAKGLLGQFNEILMRLEEAA